MREKIHTLTAFSLASLIAGAVLFVPSPGKCGTVQSSAQSGWQPRVEALEEETQALREEIAALRAVIDVLTARQDAHEADPSAHHARYSDPEAWQAVLDRDGPGCGLDADTTDGYHGTDLDQSAEVAELQDRFKHFSRDGNDVFLTSANLHVINGRRWTNTRNGLGNIIIGYNEPRDPSMGPDVRTGSHMLVVGTQNNYSSFGGIVVGLQNSSSATYASVSGGWRNEATDRYSSISGGAYNRTNGYASSISGGFGNYTSGYASSISGGLDNDAIGNYSSILGGEDNTASGAFSSVSGGSNNTASGDWSSVGGGTGNTAGGLHSSISGGSGNVASGYASHPNTHTP